MSLEINLIPSEFPNFGEGFGRLKDRDQLSKADKFILIKRQHNKCAICEKALGKDKEVAHIIPKSKGGMCYSKSPVFSDAVLPNVCYTCKTCNRKMGYDLAFWQAQIAKYYGFYVEWLRIDLIIERVKEKYLNENQQPKNYPFWLKAGGLVLLTDNQFDEQAHFQKMIGTYEPFKEVDGSLIPNGLGKSRFE